MDFRAGQQRAVFIARRKVNQMKTKLLAMILLAGGTTMFAQTRFSVGVNVGGAGAGFFQSAPPPNYFVPTRPGSDYFFVDGYWAQDHRRRHWVAGFWDGFRGRKIPPLNIPAPAKSPAPPRKRAKPGMLDLRGRSADSIHNSKERAVNSGCQSLSLLWKLRSRQTRGRRLSSGLQFL